MMPSSEGPGANEEQPPNSEVIPSPILSGFRDDDCLTGNKDGTRCLRKALLEI